MRTQSVVAGVVLLAVCLAGCSSAQRGSTAQPRTTAAATDDAPFPPPDGPLFSPTPFTVPSDGPGTWAALRDIAPRLRPGPPGDEAAERRRLQACGHLRALASAIIVGVSEDFDVEGFPELEMYATANNCPRRASAQSSYLSAKWLVERYDARRVTPGPVLSADPRAEPPHD